MTPRPTDEWIASKPTAAVPPRVRLRIVARQDGKCAVSGIAFAPGSKIEFDHIRPLADGGEHRETNLQAILAAAHKIKTAREANERAKVRRSLSKELYR